MPDEPGPSEPQSAAPSDGVGRRKASDTFRNLEKVEDAYFKYGDHADVYKGRLDGKLVVSVPFHLPFRIYNTFVFTSMLSGHQAVARS